MTEKQIIERLMLKVEETRKAQQRYFKDRTNWNKKESIGLETNLDEYVKELRKQGYQPENQADHTTQPKMF